MVFLHKINEFAFKCYGIGAYCKIQEGEWGGAYKTRFLMGY